MKDRCLQYTKLYKQALFYNRVNIGSNFIRVVECDITMPKTVNIIVEMG